MTKQPEALRLAEELEFFYRTQDSRDDNHTVSLTDSIVVKSAAELRRLHEQNQVLLNALQFFAKGEINDNNCASLEVAQRRVRTFAANAIAKAEESKHD